MNKKAYMPLTVLAAVLFLLTSSVVVAQETASSLSGKRLKRVVARCNGG